MISEARKSQDAAIDLARAATGPHDVHWNCFRGFGCLGGPSARYRTGSVLREGRRTGDLEDRFGAFQADRGDAENPELG